MPPQLSQRRRLDVNVHLAQMIGGDAEIGKRID